MELANLRFDSTLTLEVVNLRTSYHPTRSHRDGIPKKDCRFWILRTGLKDLSGLGFSRILPDHPSSAVNYEEADGSLKRFGGENPCSSERQLKSRLHLRELDEDLRMTH